MSIARPLAEPTQHRRPTGRLFRTRKALSPVGPRCIFQGQDDDGNATGLLRRPDDDAALLDRLVSPGDPIARDLPTAPRRRQLYGERGLEPSVGINRNLGLQKVSTDPRFQ